MQRGKIVVAGASAAGKTSLLNCIMEKKYEMVQTTTSIAFQQKEFQVDQETVILNFWDTAGQERYRAVTSLYFRGCHIALVVFDCTLRKSFEEINYWIQQIKEKSDTNNQTIIYIVANKCDLTEREVNADEYKAFAVENGFEVLETSAKTGLGVQELLEVIGRKYLQTKDQVQEEERKVIQAYEEKRKSCC